MQAGRPDYNSTAKSHDPRGYTARLPGARGKMLEAGSLGQHLLNPAWLVPLNLSDPEPLLQQTWSGSLVLGGQPEGGSLSVQHPKRTRPGTGADKGSGSARQRAGDGQDPGPATDQCPGKRPSADDFLSHCWAHRSSPGGTARPGASFTGRVCITRQPQCPLSAALLENPSAEN